MRAVLKGFQSAAVEKLSRSLRRMTRDYWEGGHMSGRADRRDMVPDIA